MKQKANATSPRRKDRTPRCMRKFTIKVDGAYLVHVTLHAHTHEQLEEWFREKPWDRVLWEADTNGDAPPGPPDRIEMWLLSDGNNWRSRYFYDEKARSGYTEKLIDIMIGSVQRRGSVVVREG